MEVTLDYDEEADPIPLVMFLNGELNSETKLHRNVELSLYRDKTNQNRKTVLAETDHMTYIGRNYETEGGPSVPSFSNYMVGVLDKHTMKMTLHKADLFNMSPSIKGHTNSFALENDITTERLSRDEYSSAFDKMMSSFGSARAKKAWSATKRNKVEGGVLDISLTPAMRHAEITIQNEDPVNIVQQSPFIPICNTEALTPEDVYQLNDIISKEEMDLLQTQSQSLFKTIFEDITQDMDQRYSTFVLSHFKNMSKSNFNTQKTCILLYCDYLIKMYKMSSKEIERYGFQRQSDVPESLREKLLDKFTEHGPQGVKNKARAFTQRMRDKILAYLFVLALMIEGFTLNSAELQRDLSVQTSKLVDVFRALGCTVKSEKGESNKYTTKNYNITLQIPLNFPTFSKGSKKRRFN